MLKQASTCPICQSEAKGARIAFIVNSNTNRCCVEGIGRLRHREQLRNTPMGKGSMSKGPAKTKAGDGNAVSCACLSGAACPLTLLGEATSAAQANCTHVILRRQEEERVRRKAFPQGGPILMPKRMLQEWIQSGGKDFRHPHEVDRRDVARTLREGPFTEHHLRSWDSDRDIVIELLTARHRNPECAAELAQMSRGIEWCEKWLKWDAVRERVLLVNSSIELFDSRFRFRQRNPFCAQYDASYLSSCSDPGIPPARLMYDVIDPWCWLLLLFLGLSFALHAWVSSRGAAL